MRRYFDHLERDEIRLNRKATAASSLPLWERVGVRGCGRTIDRNPSPGSHLAMRSDLSHKGKGEVSYRQNRFNQKPFRSKHSPTQGLLPANTHIDRFYLVQSFRF